MFAGFKMYWICHSYCSILACKRTNMDLSGDFWVFFCQPNQHEIPRNHRVSNPGPTNLREDQYDIFQWVLLKWKMLSLFWDDEMFVCVFRNHFFNREWRSFLGQISCALRYYTQKEQVSVIPADFREATGSSWKLQIVSQLNLINSSIYILGGGFNFF